MDLRRFFLLLAASALVHCGGDQAADDAASRGQLAGKQATPQVPASRDEPAQDHPPMPLPWVVAGETAEHFCLVTHYTLGYYPFYAVAEESQRHYARRHGYGQQSFVGRISGSAFLDPNQGGPHTLRGGGLYWQKLTAMAQVLERGVEAEDGVVRRCDWAVWMDSDVVVTNETVRLQDVVATYAPPFAAPELDTVDVLLVPDDRHPVSGGVFFVRNTPVGRGFVDAVSALYPAYKDNSLPEQSAMATVAYMAEPWPSDHKVTYPSLNLHPSVVVLPHRAINSFPDYGRNQGEHVTWQPCDFVAHMAGVHARRRVQVMEEVLATVPSCEADAR